MVEETTENPFLLGMGFLFSQNETIIIYLCLIDSAFGYLILFDLLQNIFFLKKSSYEFINYNN